MTPAEALRATVGRLEAAGLAKARSPLGVENQPSTLIDRSFSVTPSGVQPVGDRGRAGSAGFRVRQPLEVRLCHRLVPGDGLAAPETALEDTVRAIRALVAQDTALDAAGPVEIGEVRYTYAGAGAYFITTIPIWLVYNLDLRTEVPA